MSAQSEHDQLVAGLAFAYPGYLRIALRMLVAAKGDAALDEFQRRAEAAIKMGDDSPYPLAKILKQLASDVETVRRDPSV